MCSYRMHQLGLFAEIPFLDEIDRQRIEGENLLTLLERVI